MKLHSYGIRSATLRWIQAFLGNRRQKVVVVGEESVSVPAKSRVPQGSVLSLILFLVYINDLPDDIVSQVRLFADDTASYLALENKNDSDERQRDLDRLQTWEARWDMEFNPSKCQVVRVTSSRNTSRRSIYCIDRCWRLSAAPGTWGWISPATSTEPQPTTTTFTESQPTQTGHSYLLKEVSKQSPLKSEKWFINP